MMSPPPDFESGASTNSATSACCLTETAGPVYQRMEASQAYTRFSLRPVQPALSFGLTRRLGVKKKACLHAAALGLNDVYC